MQMLAAVLFDLWSKACESDLFICDPRPPTTHPPHPMTPSLICVIGVSTADKRGAEERGVAVQGSGVLGAMGRKGLLALHLAGAVSASEKVCDEAQQLHCEIKRGQKDNLFAWFFGFSQQAGFLESTLETLTTICSRTDMYG